MPEELYIDINNKLLPHEDFTYLRAEGIKLIERLSGKVWTNYNAHDPGITILEALCYALTELGYKTSFDIKDLLASDNRSTDWSNFFYTAKQVLTSNPVTITDYRKLVIDTEGIKNAWVDITSDYETLLYVNIEKKTDAESRKYQLSFTPQADNEPLRIRGLYKITIEYEDDIIADNKQELINATVRKKLNINRNLCEDFLTIRPVNYELFRMEAEVKVKEGTDIEKINAKIFQVINNFFSPSIRFYTLEQMLKNCSATEIFEGPSLKNGFIDTQDLEQSEKYMDIHLSDIINLIMNIPDVIAVLKCVFPIETQSAFSDFTQWITNIKEKEKAPKLDIDNSVITFFRSGDRHRSESEKQPDKQRVVNIYNFLQSEVQSSKLKNTETDIAVPDGENMEVSAYYPFQYNLPVAYGMQEKIFKGDNPKDQAGLSPRDRQILQLRGYLMVFEQIMADYLTQLTNIKQLFSFDSSIHQSFFPQPLAGIHDMENLFVNYKKYHEDLLKLVETDQHFLKKRNELVNHLLARLGENGEDYILPDKRNPMAEIHIKSNILADYVAISSYRGGGFDYSNTDKVWDTDNVAGMKRRICRLLGLRNFNTTYITSDWITIEKVQKPGNATRLKVILNDPEKEGNILLESNEYKDESEINEIIKYMLQSGFDKSLYEIDARPTKNSYNLKRKNDEGSFDLVASSNLKEEALENNLRKTLETLESLAGRENFHILENILLRPRINPQETGTRRDPGKVEATELLTVPSIPEKDFVLSQKPTNLVYTFKKTRTQDPASHDKVIWKLSLRKEEKEVLVSPEEFVFESHIRKREERIRQLGTDDANYLREKNAEGRYKFQLADRSKQLPQVLAVCERSYLKEEARETEIKALIRFFAFEIELNDKEENEPDLNSFADPYSFRISLFIPVWPAKFRDPGFRHVFEKAVYLETPAHVYPDVYWLEYNEMKEFEIVYKAWLQEIAVNAIPDVQIVNNLISEVNKIRTANYYDE